MGKDLYGSRKPAGGYGEEGIAQWARFYVTDPARLAKDAPTFASWVEQNVFPKVPALKAALDQAQRDFADYQAAPATARFDAMIDVKPPNRFVESVRRMTDGRRLATAMVDDLHEIRRAVEDLGTQTSPDKNAYTFARLSRGSAGIAEEMVERGIINPRSGQRATRGIAHILRELQPEDLQPFRRYLMAERTLEVAGRGVDTGFSIADAKDIVGRTPAHLRRLGEEVWKISNALIDYREAKGLLTPEEAKEIKEKNQKRVAMYVRFEDNETAASRGIGRGFGRNSSGLQAIKGSARTKIDPLESMITDVYKTVKQSHSAEVLSALVEHAEATQGGGRVVEVLSEVPKDHVAVRLDDNVVAQLQQMGFIPPNGGLGPHTGLIESFSDATTPGAREAKDLVRPLVINGKRKWIQINDARLYDALEGLGTPELKGVMRLLSAPTRVLRTGATLTLEFIGRNPVRDAWTASIRSQAGFRLPGVDLARGLFHVLKQDEMYQRWRMSGADNAAMLGLDRAATKRHLDEIIKSPGARVAGWVLHPVDRLRMVSSLLENATRVGEYRAVERAALARGGTAKSAMTEASLASRDVTVDFARAGQQARVANQLMAFFNANIQGVANLAADLKTRPAVVLPRILATITIPSIALNLLAWKRRLESGDTQGAAAYLEAHRSVIASVATKAEAGNPGALRIAYELIQKEQRNSAKVQRMLIPPQRKQELNKDAATRAGAAARALRRPQWGPLLVRPPERRRALGRGFGREQEAV